MDSVDPAFVATVVVGVQIVPSVVPMATRTTLSSSGSNDVNRTLTSPARATLNDRDVVPPAMSWLEKNTAATVGVGVTTLGVFVQAAAPSAPTRTRVPNRVFKVAFMNVLDSLHWPAAVTKVRRRPVARTARE